MQTKQLYKRYSLQLAEENSESYTSMKVKNIKVSSAEMVKAVNSIFQLDKKPEEHLILMCLNSKNYINAIFEVSHGDIDSTEVNIANILKRALLVNSKKIIIFHNHPSGDVNASKHDYILTDKLFDVGEMLGITLLDHLIIAKGNYNSLLCSKDGDK